MFELPELLTISRQMNEILPGRIVEEGRLGNRPHKFVWYNRTPEEFARLTQGRIAGRARVRGRWLFLPLEPGYVLLLGELGGKLLFHASGEPLPDAYHLLIRFEDGAAMSAMTQMWGAMELYEQGRECERAYIRDMRTPPADAAFTFEYFNQLIDEAAAAKPRSVKALLVQDQLIPGLGNAIAQDIMWSARLHPRHPIAQLSHDQRNDLHQAICVTLSAVTDAGGRDDETDLFAHPGGYRRIMDRATVGAPCRRCGRSIEKIQYLGGACYLCPACQR